MDTAVLCAFGPGPSLLYPPGQVMLDWLFLPFPKENHALTNCSYCHDTYLTKGNDNKTSTYWHWYLHVYSITLHLECLQHIGTIIPPSPYHHNPGHHRHQHHDHHHYNQHKLYNNKKRNNNDNTDRNIITVRVISEHKYLCGDALSVWFSVMLMIFNPN